MNIFINIRALWKENRFDVFMLMLAALFPVYRTFTSVVMLALFAIATIAMHFRSKTPGTRIAPRVQSLYFFVSTAFYFCMLVSLIYSSDFKTGFDFLVANSYLILYPLLVFFFVRDLSPRDVNLIMCAFILGCILLGVYIHFLFFNAGLYTDFRGAEYNDLPFRTVLSDNKFHPTYVSMWFLFCALYLLKVLFGTGTGILRRVLILLSISFFIISAVLLSVKITIIAFVFSVMILLFHFVKSKLVFMASCLVLGLVFVLAIYNVSFMKARFIDEFNSTELKPPVGLHTNSLNMRVGIYQCAWEVFKTNWLAGTGIGDAQSELNNCYASFDTNAYKESVYNTHNNYFAFAVAIGSIGLSFFVFMLIFHLLQSIKYGNLLFLSFLVFIMICLLGENILSRNPGVVFYSLFCAVLARQNLQKHNQL